MQYLTLGRTCARGMWGGGQSECMTTSTSVSSLTAQLAARALPIQLFLSPISVRMYRLQVRCEAGRTGDLVPLKIAFSTRSAAFKTSNNVWPLLKKLIRPNLKAVLAAVLYRNKDLVAGVKKEKQAGRQAT